MSEKTLKDAKDGLVRYWGLRPDGGTRAELISLAVLQGFQEPLLNEWLDVFLQGFVDTGHIESPIYESLTARLREVGLARAAKAADGMFAYLTRPGNTLYRIRLKNHAARLQARIDELQTELDLIALSRTSVENKLSGQRRAVALVCLDEGAANRQRQIVSFQQQIDTINGVEEE